MKYFLFISLIASFSFATQTLSPKHAPLLKQPKHTAPVALVQASEKARFIYREFLPNREDSFIIQATKCNSSAKSELWIEKFKTNHKVVDGEARTLHIYARAGDCSETKLSSVWSETIKIPKSDKMTQVYITILSDNIMVL